MGCSGLEWRGRMQELKQMECGVGNPRLVTVEGVEGLKNLEILGRLNAFGESCGYGGVGKLGVSGGLPNVVRSQWRGGWRCVCCGLGR